MSIENDDRKQRKKEKGFREWIESIEFVDDDGKVVPPELEDDDSPDPENDRGE